MDVPLARLMALDFAGQWPLYELVKICFACGGPRGTITVLCLVLLFANARARPAGELLQVWMLLELRRQLGPCYMLELKRCVSVPGCECCELRERVCRVWARGQPWSRRRAGWRRPAPPQPARGSLRVAVDYLLLTAPISTRWARFPGRSRRACGCGCTCFFKDFAFWRPQNAKIFRPRRGARSQFRAS